MADKPQVLRQHVATSLLFAPTYRVFATGRQTNRFQKLLIGDNIEAEAQDRSLAGNV